MSRQLALAGFVLTKGELNRLEKRIDSLIEELHSKLKPVSEAREAEIRAELKRHVKIIETSLLVLKEGRQNDSNFRPNPKS